MNGAPLLHVDALERVAPEAGAVQRAVVRQAAQWMARLQSDGDPAVRTACLRWRAAHPSHELAWQRMAGIGGDLATSLAPVGVPMANATFDTLQRQQQRRSALKGMLGLAGVGLICGGVAYPELRRTVLADQYSPVGERRTLVLQDGTQVTLNTASAIDVSYTGTLRSIRLLKGEIYVRTSGDPLGRPLQVETAAGLVRPVGTQFLLRDLQAGRLRASVLEGAIDIHAARMPDNAVRLQAGQQCEFTVDGVERLGEALPSAAAWMRGMLVADRMPLGDFLQELARYRHGWVRCQQDIAAWEVVGAFSVDDTDAALVLLTHILPIRLLYRSRYWLSVQAV